MRVLDSSCSHTHTLSHEFFLLQHDTRFYRYISHLDGLSAQNTFVQWIIVTLCNKIRLVLFMHSKQQKLAVLHLIRRRHEINNIGIKQRTIFFILRFIRSFYFFLCVVCIFNSYCLIYFDSGYRHLSHMVSFHRVYFYILNVIAQSVCKRFLFLLLAVSSTVKMALFRRWECVRSEWKIKRVVTLSPSKLTRFTHGRYGRRKAA